MTPLTPDEFNAAFDQFSRTCVRVEQLQTYTVDAETPRIQAWRDGQPRPERSPRTSPWLRRIQETTAAGKTWQRYRIIERPLSEYLQYQLVGYEESQAAGDQIFIVDRAAHSDLNEVRRDWWGFDLAESDAFVILMNYDDEGRPLQHDLTRDPAVIADCRRHLDLLAVWAIPLHEALPLTSSSHH